MECPKSKPQLQLVLKDFVMFKKKIDSSVTSRNTSESQKKESPIRKEYKPSAYADELLRKYEANAQRQEPMAEDLGSRLERLLKERDELLARQNAGLS